MRSIVVNSLGLYIQSALTFFILKNLFMILANGYRIQTLFIEYNQKVNNNLRKNETFNNGENWYELNTNF
jgi:hypothetical protein